jgi:uncharacterized protein YyaL (SSP411 family)
MKDRNIITSKNSYNHLKGEKSPYLIQHSKNPVDWYPWGDEAFEKAKQLDKPIFLSIGYSTCHWCHVMAHESFEDLDVAELLNNNFVAVKVDREERPDIDSVYMTACQIMTGTGGWPLTIIMTHDKKPFFAGTYFPKESSFGTIGLKDLLLNVMDIWRDERKDAIDSGDQIFTALKEMSVNTKGKKLDSTILEKTYDQLSKVFDVENGGFGDFQKFPTPHSLMFLLRYWKRTGNKHSLNMVLKTLDEMAMGGIYDHVGFGFHRYSVDKNWLVPHFEKMLYDQALIAMLYTEVYSATGRAEYKKIAQQIYEYVIRDMTNVDGGFYSAEDADSEGVEGKFYYWTYDELHSILDRNSADLITEIYNVKKDGNFNDGYSNESINNILHRKMDYESIARNKGLDTLDLEMKVDGILSELFNVREKRVHPHKDDKILTDWNGLMIASLSRAFQVFGEERYVEAAKNCVNFIMNKSYQQNRLMHMFREGESAVSGNLDDYAFMIWGLMEIYMATFDVDYLQKARDLNQTVMEHFWDEENGGFYFTADDEEKVLIREKKTFDSAIPSGNSVEFLNLLRLGSFIDDPNQMDTARKLETVFSETVKRSPTGHTQFISGVDFALGPSYSVVIVGDADSEDTIEMIKLRQLYIPNTTIILKDSRCPDKTNSISEGIEKKSMINGKATAHVCSTGCCKLPTNKKSEMLKLLDETQN